MKNKALLGILLLIGLLLRIVQLGSRPVGFTWDEAAIGYNAYSLLKTGRDEYGKTSPIIFKSFGDFKPGLYIYFTVPSIKLFGLNEFATRFPSAVFGTLLLAVIYVLSRLLFPKILSISYWSLAVASINPWLIIFSRGAWEANLNLLLITLAITVFVFNLNRKSYFLNLISFGLIGLTFWTYQSSKLFTPLLIVSLFLIYNKNINIKKLFLSLILFSLFLIPIILNFNSQSGRLRVFSLFSYSRQTKDVEEILRQDHASTKNLVFYIFHSELLDQGRGVLQRYFNHLSPRFLFSEGDWTSLRHSVYKHGYFYLIEIIPLCIGSYYLLSKLKARGYQLIAIWFLLAPLPAALSRDLVSGVRSLSLSIPLIIIIGLGLSHITKKGFITIAYCLISIASVIYFLDFYFIHQPYYSAKEWVYPYKQAVKQISDNYPNYSRIYFTDKLGQPYIFTLFYLRYNPADYQKQAKLNPDQSGDVGRVQSFDKFVFGPVYWPQLRGQVNSITIGDEYELPAQDLNIPGLIRLADINYPSGQPGLRVVALP